MAIDVNVLQTVWDKVLIFGTLAIALVAILTLIFTTLYRRRDSRRRMNDEVHKWAQEINVYAIKRRREALIEGSEKAFVKDQQRELFEVYEPFRSRSVYTETVAKAVSIDLRDSVIKLRELLQKQIKYLHDLRRGTITDDNKIKAEFLSGNLSDIHDAAFSVIGKVADADVSDL